jgi:hypothetical protein
MIPDLWDYPADLWPAMIIVQSRREQIATNLAEPRHRRVATDASKPWRARLLSLGRRIPRRREAPAALGADCP